MVMNMYQPKKKKYNDLKSFAKELTDNKVKVKLYDGLQVITKDAKYTLYDGQLIVQSHKWLILLKFLGWITIPTSYIISI